MIYVGISTQTFDLRGSILFKADIAGTELDKLSRRVTRSSTLDGGVSITDSGYAHGDRTLSIVARLTEAQWERLRYIFQNYSEVVLAIPEGIFLVNLAALNNVYGEVTLQVYVSEKLAPIEEPAYYCSRDDTFRNLTRWYQTKLHGTETATTYLKGLTDYECTIDLPDSLNTQLTMLYQYLIPAGDFDITLDLADYAPDDANNGFTIELKLRSSSGDYHSSIASRTTAASTYQVTRTHKDGIIINTTNDSLSEDTEVVRVTRVGNEISLNYFANSWQTAYTYDFSASSVEIDRIEIIAYDTSNRGGSVDIDNLMFRQNCPEAYPKAWTTTCSSTTSTCSSTASTTSSSSSFSTTTTSTTSTSTTTSTTSTSSTTTTTNTISTTCSTTSTTASTVSTSTQSTTSSSTTTSISTTSSSTTSTLSTSSSTTTTNSTQSTTSTSSSTASTNSTTSCSSSSSSTSSTASTVSTTSSSSSSSSTTSSSSSTSSTASTVSTTSSTSSTVSTLSTTTSLITTTTSTCSSSSSTSSTASTQSTTSSTSSTASTQSTTSSSSSTSSTASTISTTSSTSSTLSTTSSTSTTGSTISTTSSTSSTLSTTSSTSSTASTASTTSSTASTASTTSSTMTTSSSSSTSSSCTTSTFWCDYNETFTSVDKWYIEEQVDGGETFTIVSNEGKLDIPDSVDAGIRITYQHLIGSGDFIIDIDLADYQKDASVGPVIQFFADDTLYSAGDNRVHIQLWDNAGTWNANFYYKINGGATQNVGTEALSGQPSALRIERSGNYLKGYTYISSWDIIGSQVDFGAYASNIDIVKLRLIDSSTRGGSATFDNLRFRDGCPSGYPKAWTTTTSTTTSTTTTTEPP